jgi:hypothetical protein
MRTKCALQASPSLIFKAELLQPQEFSRPNATILKLRSQNACRIRLPISRDEFDKLNQRADLTLEEAVLTFLQANRQSAFTALEISIQLNPQSPINDPLALQVKAVLQNLLTRRVVVGKWREAAGDREYFFTVP